MSLDDLRLMRLDPDQVARAVAFLDRYINTCLAEVDDLQYRDARSSGSDGYVAIADAASAAREAAQWLLYSEPDQAKRKLALAGRLYEQLGLPYGIYLSTVAGAMGTDPPMGTFIDALADLRSILQIGRPDNEHHSPTPGEAQAYTPRTAPLMAAALKHPQQQVYLLLASGGNPSVSRQLHPDIQRIVEMAVHREGVAPVGSLGTPIRHLWAIASALVAGELGTVTVARHLAAMANRYAEGMGLAQVNSYLWSNAAAPVDVGDLDIAGIAALTVHRIGQRPLLEAINDMEVNTVGMALIHAGITLASGRRPRTI